MLKLTKKADYGLIALRHLATSRGARGSASAKDIAAAYRIPLPLLSKVLQKLCRAGLLTDPALLVVPLIGPTNIGDLGGQVATNVALRALLGSYYLPYYLPYYVLDRIDRYMQRPTPPPGAPSPPDAYAAQRAFYLTQRALRCTPPRTPPG